MMKPSENVYNERSDNSMTEPMALYIHIPFCTGKCMYCDFASYPGYSRSEVEAYFKALYDELEFLKYFLENDFVFDTLFIGGGTPSAVESEYICKTIEDIPLTDDAEISIEVNPDSFTVDKAKEYARSGINRISIGIQSFDDAELQYLGRRHTSSMAEKAVFTAQNSGIKNINLDLIFGFPGQRLKSWKNTLRRAFSLGPSHISFYSLQIEEGTSLYNSFMYGDIDQLSDEMDRAMYDYILEQLYLKDFNHYEISNAARLGYECKHNLKYWSMKDYIGIGSAAHSFFKECRYSNPATIEEYIAKIEKVSDIDISSRYQALHEMIPQTKEESVTDFIFTALRTAKGIDLKKLENIYGINLMEYKKDILFEYLSNDFMKNDKGYLSFTRKGLDISNTIIADLF